MPWWRESDTFADDPRWQVLSGGNNDLADRLQAAYCRLQAKGSHQKDNGYLTHQTALETCRGRKRVLELLCTAVLDRPPWLHRKGDECDCLGEEWVAGFDFRIHGFLFRNPSRTEYDRNQAQTRDRSDDRLKALVKQRDALCCRYCRSGPLSSKAGRARDRRKVLALDHVDPDQPAGPDGENYVVACGRCNEFKGRRTPDEADMTLLPAPTLQEREQWSTRERQLFDRPPYRPHQAANQTGITAGTNHESNQKQNTDQTSSTDPITDSSTDRGVDPTADLMPSVRLETADDSADHRPTTRQDPLGTGRVGQPPPADRRAAALPARTARHPDPYHRRSRGARASPQLPPPIPDDLWPPGSTPARPT
jgi:hypothetical protein